MSISVRIPPELETFTRVPNASTLVLRGPPGSGKTMLAMALMGSFPGRRIYVSFRVTRESLLEQIPWLRKLPPGEIEVIDAFGASDDAQLPQRIEHPDRLIASSKEAEEIDQFLWLPPAVQSAWSLADATKPTMIVFDSWDAVLDQYYEKTGGPDKSGPSRSELERFLVARLMKKNLSLVLVLERDTPSALDYLVDGIVETSRRLVDGRLERWLSLLKLRGSRNPGRHVSFHPRLGQVHHHYPCPPQRVRHPPPRRRSSPRRPGLSPGSSDFAAAFGRLAPGRITCSNLIPQPPGRFRA